MGPLPPEGPGLPDAGDRRQDLPDTAADLAGRSKEKHVAQAKGGQIEDQIGAHPHRTLAAHAKQHYLGPAGCRNEHAAESARLVEVTSRLPYNAIRNVLEPSAAI
eukprot:scaffold13796_cov118-Isochrysis_galbana.AAC.8